MISQGSTSLAISLLLYVLVASVRGQGNCEDVNIPDRVDCAFSGIDEAGCIAKDCCWGPVVKSNGSTRDTPWCFFKSDITLPPSNCDKIVWTASDPGFTQADVDIMYELYKDNLNVEDSGAVVASRDPETPGGSYYFHWMRDAGLSIKAWLEINDNQLDPVKPELEAYADWVGVVQHQPDQNNDVRIEPKFYIPSGKPYDGGWCRPQTDGPGLRAMALAKYGMLLQSAGQDSSRLWDMVKFDLEWVTENWASDGCDLWEEVRSNDFYFNRMAFVYSLNVAADYADMIGEDGSNYRTVAATIADTAKAHYKDGFIYESTNRQQDGAVIHSIATFGEYLFGPTSSEAADTIKVLAKTFCDEYPINREEISSGIPGILIGRYPGDSYAGGNPWQLLTAVLGEVFYLGASTNLKTVRDNGVDHVLDVDANASWMDLLGLGEGTTLMELAVKQIEAGDAVMTRLYGHVNKDGGRVDEQIDKNTGVQTSAEGLTWSYANILHALKVREAAVALKKEVVAKLVL